MMNPSKKRLLAAAVVAASIATVTPAVAPLGVVPSATAAEVAYTGVKIEQAEVYTPSDGKTYGPGEKLDSVQPAIRFHLTSNTPVKAGDTLKLIPIADDRDNPSNAPAGNAKKFEGELKLAQNGKDVAKAKYIAGEKAYLITFTEDLKYYDFNMNIPLEQDYQHDEVVKYPLRIKWGDGSAAWDNGPIMWSGRQAREDEPINHYGSVVDATTSFIRMYNGLVTPGNTSEEARAYKITITMPKDPKFRHVKGDECGKTYCGWMDNQEIGWDVRYIDRVSQPYAWDNRKEIPESEYQYYENDKGDSIEYEFYFPNVPAGESPTVYGDKIAPYEGAEAFPMTAAYGTAPANTPRGDFQADHVENERRAQIVEIPGLRYGNKKILDGPLSSSIYNVTYPSQIITRPDDETVYPKEQGGRSIPEGYTYSAYKDVPDWAFIEPKTGIVRLNVRPDVEPGKYDIQYLLTHADNSDQIIHLKVTVKAQADVANPTYPTTTTTQNAEVVVNPENTEDIKFKAKADKGAPSWAKVAPDGTITAKPGWDVKPGTYDVPVKYTFTEDGSTKTVKAKVKVGAGTENNRYTATYPNTTLAQGKSKDLTPTWAGGTPKNAAVSTTDPAGWITSDGTTIKVQPTRDTPPGDYPVTATLTYADGSTNTADFKVTVTPGKQNDLYNPEYSKNLEVKQGDTITVSQPRDAGPATFTPTGNTPQWVKVGDNGVLTVSPTLANTPKAYTFNVQASYPDNTTKTVPVTITVVKGDDNANHHPAYTPAVVEQGKTATVSAPTDTVAKSKYARKDGPEWAAVNAKTGEIVLKPGYATPGSYPVVVSITYPDGTVGEAVAAVNVIGVDDSVRYNTAYPDDATPVKQGDTVVSPAPKGAPKGAVFTLTSGAPAWAEIDKATGVITAKPSYDQAPGIVGVPVNVRYADGTADVATWLVKVVKKTDAERYDPSYGNDPHRAKQGDTTTINPPSGEVPGGTVFTPGEGAPDWAKVDEKTGKVTVKPGYDVKPGRHTVPVKVSYPDGSSETIDVIVDVIASSDAERYDPSWSKVDVAQGKKADKPVSYKGDKPSKATYKIIGDNPLGVTVNSAGRVSVAPTFAKTPEVTAGGAKGAHDYSVNVQVTYPDKSQDTKKVTIHVTRGSMVDQVNEGKAPSWNIPTPDGKDKPGGVQIGPNDPGYKVEAPKVTWPKGVKLDHWGPCEAPNPTPEWIEVGKDGALTFKPWGGDFGKNKHTVMPGDYTIPVCAFFTDGTHKEFDVPFTVYDRNQSDLVNPVWGSQGDGDNSGRDIVDGTNPAGNPGGSSHYGTVKDPAAGTPGHEFVVPGPAQGTYPEGTKFELCEKSESSPRPDWVNGETVKVDPATGALSVTAPVGTKPGDYNIPVCMTFPDGSKQRVEVPVRILPSLLVEEFNPSYINTAVEQEGRKTVDVAFAPELRPGVVASYERGADMPAWMNVDAATGTVTVTPKRETVPAGNYTGSVVVRYTDGTWENAMVPVTVTPIALSKWFTQVKGYRYYYQNKSGVLTPSLKYGEVEQRSELLVGSPMPSDGSQLPLPNGVVFTPDDGWQPWMELAPDGSVKASPDRGVKPGLYTAYVKVTFPDDGSAAILPITFKVTRQHLSTGFTLGHESQGGLGVLLGLGTAGMALSKLQFAPKPAQSEAQVPDPAARPVQLPASQGATDPSQVTVAHPAYNPQSHILAMTGANVWWSWIAAMVMVIVGGVLVVARRGRGNA